MILQYLTTLFNLTDRQSAPLQGDSFANLRINPYGNIGSFKSQNASGAGNVTVALTVPAGQKWNVKSIFVRIQTNATVATRNIVIQVLDGGGSLMLHLFPVNNAGLLITQGASLIQYFEFAPNMPLLTASSVQNGEWYQPMPELFLGPNSQIQVILSNGVAGDTITLNTTTITVSD